MYCGTDNNLIKGAQGIVSFMLFTKRAGVSTIIAELMLLAVVVALGTIVYALASNAFGNFGLGFAGAVSNAGDSLSERIVVEQVTFSPCPNGSNQQACLYVRNVGQEEVTIVALYVTDQTTNVFVGSQSINAQILVGSFRPIGVSIQGFTVQHAHAYGFTVATSRGNTVTFNAVA